MARVTPIIVILIFPILDKTVVRNLSDGDGFSEVSYSNTFGIIGKHIMFTFPLHLDLWWLVG